MFRFIRRLLTSELTQTNYSNNTPYDLIKCSERRDSQEAFEKNEVIEPYDEDGGLDIYEVYQLDVMTGGDIIPDCYTEAWSDNDYSDDSYGSEGDDYGNDYD